MNHQEEKYWVLWDERDENAKLARIFKSESDLWYWANEEDFFKNINKLDKEKFNEIADSLIDVISWEHLKIYLSINEIDSIWHYNLGHYNLGSSYMNSRNQEKLTEWLKQQKKHVQALIQIKEQDEHKTRAELIKLRQDLEIIDSQLLDHERKIG